MGKLRYLDISPCGRTEIRLIKFIDKIHKINRVSMGIR